MVMLAYAAPRKMPVVEMDYCAVEAQGCANISMTLLLPDLMVQ